MPYEIGLSESFQNLSESSESFRPFQNLFLSESFGIFQNLSESFRIFQNLSESFRIFQNPSEHREKICNYNIASRFLYLKLNMAIPSWAAIIIKALHILFILFVILGIFSNDPLVLILYLVTLVSLQLHWYMNNDTCCLTITEKLLTGRSDDESFMHQLVSPIYKISDQRLSKISKIVVYMLIVLTLLKFWKLGITPYRVYLIIRDAVVRSYNSIFGKDDYKY